MPLKEDAEEIKSLALEPVCRAPDIHHRINNRSIGIQQRLDAQAVIQRCREQMIDNGKTIFRVSCNGISVGATAVTVIMC